MKKIFSICMFCALAGLIVACNRYKTFDEEITALNAQYKTSAGEILNCRSKSAMQRQMRFNKNMIRPSTR